MNGWLQVMPHPQLIRWLAFRKWRDKQEHRSKRPLDHRRELQKRKPR